MKIVPKVCIITCLAFLLGGICVAQVFRGGGGRGFRGGGRGGNTGPIWVTEGGRTRVDEREVRTAREISTHSSGGEAPIWTNALGFSKDVFTFVRIIRDNDSEAPRGAGQWITDYPDSDLNLSFRLQQMTSLKVDPDGRVLRLTNPDLFKYPWIYMVEPGSLSLRADEVTVLRKYLQNGGVLMVDDFWGEWQWDIFASQMQRVLPDRKFVELPMDHPIFHSVFQLNVPKNKLQTPNVRVGSNSQYDGVTWEQYHPSRDGGFEDTQEMHVRAILDDKGRIMVIATHNCDNGDAWEREGDDDYFFHEFSEKRGFPLGINILVYIMTH